MGYRFLEHTADLAIEVTAEDLGGLFAEALRGLTDCVTDVARVEPRVERRLEASAPELDLLLVDWLGEAVAAYETRGELYSAAEVEVAETADGHRVSGRVRGEPWDGERHPLKVLIKGVTYHGLEVARRPGGWRARLVFDI